MWIVEMIAVTGFGLTAVFRYLSPSLLSLSRECACDLAATHLQRRSRKFMK